MVFPEPRNLATERARGSKRVERSLRRREPRPGTRDIGRHSTGPTASAFTGLQGLSRGLGHRRLDSARSLRCSQRDKRARNPSFLLKDSTGHFAGDNGNE